MGVFHAKPLGQNASRIIRKLVPPSAGADASVDIAYFAGGKFWFVELVFQRVPGVLDTEVGYTQGDTENPTFESVSAGNTNHVEAVRVSYDTSVISYEDLLTVFWDIIDPTLRNQQGTDFGTQFRSGIYYTHDLQRIAAQRSRDEIQKLYTEASVKTEIALHTDVWYPAEERHQQYLARNGQSAAKGDITPIKCRR